MSLAAPASSARRLEAALTRSEQERIGLRLISAMVAGGLFLAGSLQVPLLGPSQAPVGDLLRALAAFLIGIPIFASALRGLMVEDRDVLVDQLVALAVLAAMVSGEFTTAVVVPLIMDLSHFLEERSVLGVQAAAEGLEQLQAREALRLTEEGPESVSPEDLRVGDRIRILPGELVPADGRVLRGQSALDTSSVTGESVPSDVGVDDSVFAGCVNLVGALEVEVTGTGQATALGRVIELLGEAERSKTPIMKLLERYAGYYVPIILLLAAVALFVSREMGRAVTVLVVGCPGALLLAGPTATIAALSAGARRGILVKNSRFVEVLAEVDQVVFDKTGTLTTGNLAIEAVRPHGEEVGEGLLQEAALFARGSSHPASRAIVRAAGKLECREPDSLSEEPGKGVRGEWEGVPWLLGKGTWLEEEGIFLPDPPEHQGPTVWLARDGVLRGCLLLADAQRPEAAAVVEGLRALGVHRITMVTGDRQEVADAVAGPLGLDEVVAEALPEEKLVAIEEAKQRGGRVMVVGDGINDALALAAGDVGVAMGAMGSDIAIQSADVALMVNDLGRVGQAIRLSRATRWTIHQNILVGSGISIGMLALAAGGFLSPMAGALLHNVGELFVIVNSARLLRFETDPDPGSRSSPGSRSRARRGEPTSPGGETSAR